MSRLARSGLPALLRRLQMSQTQVFYFVEGISSDLHIYDAVCRAGETGRIASHRVWRSNRISGSGGKAPMLAFYDYLRRSGRLHSQLGSRRTAVGFFMDKDIDDLRRSKRRSPHVIYTRSYDIEGHLYENCSIRAVVANCGDVTDAVAGRIVGQNRWCQTTAERWRPWLELCILSDRLHLSCGCGYGRPSAVNNPPYGPADQTEVTLMWSRVTQNARNHGHTAGYIQAQREAVARVVQKRFNDERHGELFKGKWYSVVLAKLIVDSARSPVTQLSQSTVLAATKANVDYGGKWSAPLRRAARRIAWMVR